MKWGDTMNETKFNFTYFFETLVNRILHVAVSLPALYTTLLTVFLLVLFGIEEAWIGFAALGVGFTLKIVFTLSSKRRKLTSEWFVIAFDLAGGLLVVVLSGFVFEFIVLGLTVLYLVYYSYVTTISYTRLGHTAEDILHDLRHRHEKQNKQAGKRK
jgi:hypothetical protein